MKRNERIVIYGLLTTLLGLNGLLILATTGSVATAAPLRLDDVLGPADGVELIAADDDEEALVLRNVKGHMSWGEEAHQRAYSIGFVQIGKLLNGLMTGDSYHEEREQLREEIEAKDKEVTEQLNAMNEQLTNLEPDDPQVRQLQQQGGQLIQEFRNWVAVRQDQLAAQQLEKVYRELVSAVNVVADRLDIDLVYRFIATDDPFEARGLEQTTMAIQLRPVLRYPTDLDITIDVMEELSLDLE